MEFIFWLLLALILYTYFGYPLLLFLLCKLKSESIKRVDYYPSVSFITVAYNEEDCIKEKIENSLSIDYPSDKFEIIIASDGSTDKTNSIITNYQGIKYLKFEERRGKASCLNDAVKEAKGEILVFSDANVIYDSDAIKKLVRNFSSPKIGAVTGEVRYVIDEASPNTGEGSFSKYERFIRICESRFYSLTGVNGAMYTIRKNLYTPLKKNIITDDLVIALNVTKQGYKIIYEAEAKGVEKIYSSAKDEFRRKVRIIAGGYQALKEIGVSLIGFPLFVIFGIFSHKLLRWLVPFFIFGIFVINTALLNFTLYRILFKLQIIFYVVVFLGYALEKMRIKSPFSFFYYFIAVNFASICGLFKFLAGTQKVTWSRGR